MAVPALGGVPVKLAACAAGAVLAGTIWELAYLILPPNSLAGRAEQASGAAMGLCSIQRPPRLAPLRRRRLYTRQL